MDHHRIIESLENNVYVISHTVAISFRPAPHQISIGFFITVLSIHCFLGQNFPAHPLPCSLLVKQILSPLLSHITKKNPTKTKFILSSLTELVRGTLMLLHSIYQVFRCCCCCCCCHYLIRTVRTVWKIDSSRELCLLVVFF